VDHGVAMAALRRNPGLAAAQLDLSKRSELGAESATVLDLYRGGERRNCETDHSVKPMFPTITLKFVAVDCIKSGRHASKSEEIKSYANRPVDSIEPARTSTIFNGLVVAMAILPRLIYYYELL
jgi:hypothetical protein